MIKGIKFSGIASGIKPSGLDLGLVLFQEKTHVLSLYTSNRVKAAHILYDRKYEGDPVRALVVNSGCANACTGKEGIADLEVIGEKLAKLLKIGRTEVLFASTGVIGKRLPVDTIKSALPVAVKSLREGHAEDFAKAIITTDTHHKLVKETFKGKKDYSIIGVAKGSGMLNPNFATMLAFVFTDYPIAPDAIRAAFRQAVTESFEKITVDGECSTNDTVMLFTRRGEQDLSALGEFKAKLRSVLKDLAIMLIRDGEGATKVAHIMIKGARKKETAEKIARRIAISPLVKTAFFGSDPNWGRIICAAGDAGVPVEPAKVDITLQDQEIVKAGVELPFDEEKMKRMMNKNEIAVVVNLNEGKAVFDIYTTDLTFDYVKINASYRS
ncbi:MAG TPA: bifunctional glutamate N-acetyltransferase/amino-acid acetyltransferase ArgJ [Syntrophorhabdaceae bacterium]|nr:bifunctional glutamate N-acetyltransferase/amino-acid acetyltransferase ArgJ [Syntrophorhabdaceae bacterium]